MAGYSVPQRLLSQQVKCLIDDLFVVLNNPRLPFSLFRVYLNVVANRINPETCENIKKLIENEEKPFSPRELVDEMNEYLGSVDPGDLGIEKGYFESLINVCERLA